MGSPLPLAASSVVSTTSVAAGTPAVEPIRVTRPPSILRRDGGGTVVFQLLGDLRV